MRRVVLLVFGVSLVMSACTGGEVTSVASATATPTAPGTAAVPVSSATTSTPTITTQTKESANPTITTQTTQAAAPAGTPPSLLVRIDPVPPLAVGSRLEALNSSRGGFAVLVEEPGGWQLWRSSTGETWQAEVLPGDVFEGRNLRTVAVLPGSTFVAGGLATGGAPAVWRRDDGGAWTEMDLERRGVWGVVYCIIECDGRLLFAGHDSDSNVVLEYRFWTLDEGGKLMVVFRADSGPPGSGTPAPQLYCVDGRLIALVTRASPVDLEDPWSGEFSMNNEIWSSSTGEDWQIVATGALQPAVVPLGVAAAGSTLVVVSAEGDIATSSDGITWVHVDAGSVGFDSDDWIDSMGGGEVGLFVAGLDHSGDPLDPVMWWTLDGVDWHRIDDHPALDPWGIEIAAASHTVVIASRRSFADGTPAIWVATVGQ